MLCRSHVKGEFRESALTCGIVQSEIQSCGVVNLLICVSALLCIRSTHHPDETARKWIPNLNDRRALISNVEVVPSAYENRVAFSDVFAQY